MRTNYLVRSASFAYAAVPIALHMHAAMAGTAAWALYALQFFAYPHLVYLRARYSARPGRAELDNLYLDAVLMGVWSAVLGFPTWIAFSLVGATTLNAAVNRGPAGMAVALLCSLAGAGAWLLLAGWDYRPQTSDLVAGLAAVGALAYGASVALYVSAAQQLGATRAQAVFATAPFAGAALSWGVLGEPVRGAQIAGGLLLAASIALLLRARHEHEHVHEALEHAHEHRHDDGHHDHPHDAPVAGGVRHAHRHRHEPRVHAHPHWPDLHHRHRHD